MQVRSPAAGLASNRIVLRDGATRKPGRDQRRTVFSGRAGPVHTSPGLPRGPLPSCTRRRLGDRMGVKQRVAAVEVAQPALLGQRPWRTNESLPERPCLCQCPPPATLLAAVAPPPDLGLPP